MDAGVAKTDHRRFRRTAAGRDFLSEPVHGREPATREKNTGSLPGKCAGDGFADRTRRPVDAGDFVFEQQGHFFSTIG